MASDHAGCIKLKIRYSIARISSVQLDGPCCAVQCTQSVIVASSNRDRQAKPGEYAVEWFVSVRGTCLETMYFYHNR